MPLNLNSDKLIVVCKPDQQPIQYTGYSATIIVGSGDTTVNNISGSTWVIYSPTGGTSSGGTVTLVGSGGTWTGLLSGTTWIVYSPPITQLQIDLFNLENNFTGHTGDTSIHTPYSAITAAISAATSGMTSSWSGLTGQPSGNTDLMLLLSEYVDYQTYNYNNNILSGVIQDITTGFTAHTGNTTIHYPMSGISITESQIQDFGDYALESELTGLTQSFTSHTGNTVIHYPMSGISITESQISDLQNYALESQLSLYQPLSGMTIYLTGVTWNDVTNKPDLSIYLTGATNGSGGIANLASTSGQTVVIKQLSISGGLLGINDYGDGAYVEIALGENDVWNAISNHLTGYTTTTNFNNYTGTTAPEQFFPISGYSFIASGACQIATSGNEVTIYAPSGGTSSTTVLVGSGATVVDNISGSTWVVYSPSGGTGGGVSEAVFTGYTGVTAPATYAPLLASIKVVTGTSYTLLTTDSGKILQFTATGATTITIPSGSTFAQGFQVTLVNYGNGTTSGVKTLAAQSGATIKSANSALKLSTIFGAASVYKTPTAATWVAFGDLTA